jgi:pimeloyl-ACP methyl ester carboxylesterase
MGPTRVLLLPGAVLPAELAYGALLGSLGPGVDAVAKDLEVYSEPEPPAGYTLDTEVDGVSRVVDDRGWNVFHLAGYSGGGAAALAFTARYPKRVQSLALLEPAWAGTWDWSPEHRQVWAHYRQLRGRSPDDFMTGFIRLGIKDGVNVPPTPPGDQPPWIATRPAGIGALMDAFDRYEVNRSALAAYRRPVYFALGALSNPHHYGEIAQRLSKVFPNFQLEVFAKRHHFDPPHRIEPDRLATSLLELWNRTEAQPAET